MRTLGGLPPNLLRLEENEEGRAWLAALPSLVAECAEQWDLEPGDAFPGSNIALALAVRRRDGSPAVLKIQLAGLESEHEAAALAHWDGDGAVRLLEHDPARRALLLERAEPGTYLSETGSDHAFEVLTALLPRLWKPAGPPFRTLADESAWWASYLVDEWERTGRPFARRLLDAARDALETLPASQGELVLVHQDLHGHNVLRAEREPWLAIDPKPLLGEREFALAPIIRSSELGHGRAAVVARLDRLCADLRLDRERARLWALAQTVAWSFGHGPYRLNVKTAIWLLDA